MSDGVSEHEQALMGWVESVDVSPHNRIVGYQDWEVRLILRTSGGMQKVPMPGQFIHVHIGPRDMDNA